jgi:AraC-like DNA-binding protein
MSEALDPPQSTLMLDTRLVCPDKRFKVWADSIGVIFDPSLDGRTDPSQFRAELHASMYGQVFCGRVDSVTQRFDRSEKKIIADGLDHYIVQVFKSGYCEVVDGNTTRTVRPGDIYIIDAAAPLEAVDYAFEHVTMMIPRDFLTNQLVSPDAHHRRIIPGYTPLARLLYNYIITLDEVAATTSLKERELMVDPFLILTEQLLNHHSGETTLDPYNPATNLALLSTIKRYIDDNLAHKQLKPDMICAAHGLSRSALYRLFEPLEGVANYIRNRRLRYAMKDLLDGSNQNLLIYEIAYRWGFSSETDFTRAFKRQYGISPKMARVRHIASYADAKHDAALFEYETWVRNLSR